MIPVLGCVSAVVFCILFFFSCLLKERSRTSAPGRDVSGASPVPMSWLAISGNTQVLSLSSVECVTAVSPALITWPYTWRDTRARNNQVRLFGSLKRNRDVFKFKAVTPQWRHSQQCWPQVIFSLSLNNIISQLPYLISTHMIKY